MEQTIITVLLILVGYWAGRHVEKRHFARLNTEEKRLSHILVSDLRQIPPNWNVESATLVSGATCIATDYFKVFVSQFQNLVGGRLEQFETLMERARREAVVRMVREAEAIGASAVWNVRVETSTITGKGKPGGVEVIVYGTALKLR